MTTTGVDAPESFSVNARPFTNGIPIVLKYCSLIRMSPAWLSPVAIMARPSMANVWRREP